MCKRGNLLAVDKCPSIRHTPVLYAKRLNVSLNFFLDSPISLFLVSPKGKCRGSEN